MSTQPQSPTPEQAVRDRRTVLRGAAVIGLAGAATPLLAACGSDGNDAGSGSSSSSAPQSSEPTTSASSSAPAGGGTALASTSEIPVGGGKVFPDAKVVVTQPAKGQFKGFTAVCTHMHCIVADVNGGTINCGCHGSKFNITDGSVARSPAPRPLKSKRISVQNGAIRLA
jgi:nitrite reductase/ring-hydroxylating ferredoxin subunit